MNIHPVATPDEWHALRAKNIGASETAILFGCAPAYAPSLYALWQIKSGKIPAPDVNGNRVEAGIRFEEAIAHWVADVNEWKIRRFPGYATHDTVAGMGCTPDFEIIDHPDGPGLLECKSVDWLQHKRVWEGEPPLHIQVQLQAQLCVTGYKWGAVGAVVGGNEPVSYRYEYRPKIGAEIEKRVAAFWKSIADGVEPPVDGSDSTADALAAIFPASVPESEIDLTTDNQFSEQYAAFKQARLDRKAADATEQAAKNWLLAKIGTAEMVRYGGKIVMTAKSQTRKSYTVKESTSRVLRLKED